MNLNFRMFVVFQDIFQNYEIIFKYNAIKFQNAIKNPKKITVGFYSFHIDLKTIRMSLRLRTRIAVTCFVFPSFV